MKSLVIILALAASFSIAGNVAAAPTAPTKSKKEVTSNVGTMSFAVEGMTCGGCESTIEEKVSGVAGVATVDADHKAKNVVITAKPGATVDPEAIKKAVKEAGYTVK